MPSNNKRLQVFCLVIIVQQIEHLNKDLTLASFSNFLWEQDWSGKQLKDAVQCVAKNLYEVLNIIRDIHDVAHLRYQLLILKELKDFSGIFKFGSGFEGAEWL